MGQQEAQLHDRYDDDDDLEVKGDGSKFPNIHTQFNKICHLITNVEIF